MHYVYVADSASTDKLGPTITRLTGDCLYSLIGGLRQSGFGIHTMSEVARRIREYRSRLLLPNGGSQYIDSGGYSIIRGDVPPQAVRRFIKCYNLYVEHEMANYERLFSLDIPFSRKHPTLNTRQNILELNRESLTDMRAMLDSHPQLTSKLFFVWHFKMASQYGVWKQLYSELELGRFVKHRAIGGMVGMREVTKKAFSPFTAIAFRCLQDFLNDNQDEKEFRLHFLGMYIPYDRFQIAFLERLFQHYLGPDVQVVMTYDSINYAHTARMNKNVPIYHMAGSELVTFPRAIEVPLEVLISVYDEGIEIVLPEIELRKSGRLLMDCNTFGPLSIHSNICLDRFFEQIIEEHGLVGLVTKASSPTAVISKMTSLLDDLSVRRPDVFTRQMVKAIQENMEITAVYDRWFRESRNSSEFDLRIQMFIDWMGFPDLLR